jgi:hypothetical protein
MYYTDSVSGMCVISEGYFSTEYISVFANVPLISGSHSISFCSQWNVKIYFYMIRQW